MLQFYRRVRICNICKFLVNMQVCKRNNLENKRISYSAIRKSSLFRSEILAVLSNFHYLIQRLILIGGQHNQCTSFDGLNVIFFCQAGELIIFGARIKNDPFGFQRQYIVVILFLIIWIEI